MQEVMVGIILFLLMSYGIHTLLKRQLMVVVEIEEKTVSFSHREDQLNAY